MLSRGAVDSRLHLVPCWCKSNASFTLLLLPELPLAPLDGDVADFRCVVSRWNNCALGPFDAQPAHASGCQDTHGPVDASSLTSHSPHLIPIRPPTGSSTRFAVVQLTRCFQPERGKHIIERDAHCQLFAPLQLTMVELFQLAKCPRK